MKLSILKYILSFFLFFLAASLVVVSVMPNVNQDQISSCIEDEGDTESEGEKETAKEDYSKESFDKLHMLNNLNNSAIRRKLSFYDHSTQNVHLDIFTPPPEC